MNTIWVCGCCGMIGSRRSLGSCMFNAVECWPSSLIYENGRLKYAVPCTEEWVEPPPPKTPKQPESEGHRARRLARRAERRSARG